MKRSNFLASIAAILLAPFGIKAAKKLERAWGPDLIFDKNELNFGNILESHELDSSFRLEITTTETLLLQDDPGVMYEMKGLGDGNCEMYLNGKYIKTIPYPKDSTFKFSDFDQEHI